MQVTPTNALFSALSSQIQSIQRSAQNQPKNSSTAGSGKTSQGARIQKSDLEGAHTVINASGQVETEGSLSDINLREAPRASLSGEQAFIAPGSIVDIIV